MKTKKTRYFKKKKTIRNKKSLLKKKTIRNKSLLLKMIKKRKSLTRKYRKVSGGNDNDNDNNDNNEKVKEMEEEVKEEMEKNPTKWFEDYNAIKNKLDMLNNLYNNNIKYGNIRYHDDAEAEEEELTKSKQNLLDFKGTDDYKTYLIKNDILKTYLTKNRFQRWLAKKKLSGNEKIIKENVDNLRNDEIEKEKKMKIQANVEIQRARQKIIEEEEE